MDDKIKLYTTINIPVTPQQLQDKTIPDEYIRKFLDVEVIERWFRDLDLNSVNEFEGGEGLYESYFDDTFHMWDDGYQIPDPVRIIFTLHGEVYMWMDVFLKVKDMEIEGITTISICVDGDVDTFLNFPSPMGFQDTFSMCVNIRPDGTYQKTYSHEFARPIGDLAHAILNHPELESA